MVRGVEEGGWGETEWNGQSACTEDGKKSYLFGPHQWHRLKYVDGDGDEDNIGDDIVASDGGP